MGLGLREVPRRKLFNDILAPLGCPAPAWPQQQLSLLGTEGPAISAPVDMRQVIDLQNKVPIQRVEYNAELSDLAGPDRTILFYHYHGGRVENTCVYCNFGPQCFVLKILA